MFASFLSETLTQPLAKFQLLPKRSRYVITIPIIIERMLFVLKRYSHMFILLVLK